jgi:hypothetical protein
MPITREVVMSEFNYADGAQGTQTSSTEIVGPGQNIDVDHVTIHENTELACGCFSPAAKIAGVCAECAREGHHPNVCTAHYVVCRCGTPCCWKHSRPVEDTAARICSRCQIKEQNKATKAAVVGGTKRALRWLLFREG